MNDPPNIRVGMHGVDELGVAEARGRHVGRQHNLLGTLDAALDDVTGGPRDG